jgi:ABC-2 type transport system ATP-binding protein
LDRPEDHDPHPSGQPGTHSGRGRAPAITADGLTKTFEPSSGLSRLVRRSPRTVAVRALVDVGFTVGSGETVALTGRNGSGKSTLLRILASLVTPSSGTATVAGVSVVDPTVRRQLALAQTDDRAFSQRLSGRENLEFFAALHDADDRVDEVLDMVGLTAVAGDGFATYSTGMRQRLALARALLPRAPVLLLDEPFRALDRDGAGRVQAIVEEESARGTTVLVATHDLTELDGLWTRELSLDDGRLVKDAPR